MSYIYLWSDWRRSLARRFCLGAGKDDHPVRPDVPDPTGPDRLDGRHFVTAMWSTADRPTVERDRFDLGSQTNPARTGVFETRARSTVSFLPAASLSNATKRGRCYPHNCCRYVPAVERALCRVDYDKTFAVDGAR